MLSDQFCPKCGASVTRVLPATPQAIQPLAPSKQSGKIWGIDKRWIIIAIILVIVVVPVFPRDKIIYVDGQTVTTQTFQSTSYVTSLQSYAATTQKAIQVYVGNIEMVSDQYYQYYYQYYQYCWYDQYGNIYCDYSYWPSGYTQYTTTIQIDSSDRYVKREIAQESGGLYSVTLTSYDGQAQIFRHVASMDLTLTGTANVEATGTETITLTNSVVNPQTTVSTVPCDKCIPQHVTERVSILQLLLGY